MPPQCSPYPRTAMAILHIDLQDGFSDDTVVVRVDGREVYRGDHVSTAMLLGFAHTFEVEVEGGRTVVDIAVPSRGWQERIAFDVTAAEVWLAVTLVRGGIVHHLSDQPFGYA